MTSACLLLAALIAPPAVGLIRPSGDGTHFIHAATGEPFTPWGFNYDHDGPGRLLEEYWHDEWPAVVEDFSEMKGLGANVVRVHLQLDRFMETAERPNRRNLDRLRKLVRLAEETGLYLDVTGLGCYHKQDVPAWYDSLGEAARWEVQARFWKAVAGVCRDSPAIFCYDLMNEPVVSGGKNADEWLVGEPLGGKYFVQRITLDPAGRTSEEIAARWVATLSAAIRSVDDRHMITVGVIPWVRTFPGAKPLFYSPEAGGPLDFVSVHFYPGRDQPGKDLADLKVYEVGKPLVIEEIFPLQAGIEQTAAFIQQSRPPADGWMSFYWGTTAEEYEEEGGLKGALIGGWLRRFPELRRDLDSRN